MFIEDIELLRDKSRYHYDIYRGFECVVMSFPYSPNTAKEHYIYRHCDGKLLSEYLYRDDFEPELVLNDCRKLVDEYLDGAGAMSNFLPPPDAIEVEKVTARRVAKKLWGMRHA